jgi:hypothetical protein
MINVEDTKEVLIKMLEESKFDFNNPNAKLAWKIFKDFFDIEVECDDDALLFQCGVYKFTGEDLFSIEFVRQFVSQAGEYYDDMYQLRLTIYYKPDEELQGLETNLWTYDCDSVGEFFDKVENLNGFRVSIENFVPFKSEIELENAE